MEKVKNVLRAIRLTWQCDKKYIVIKGVITLLKIVMQFVSLYFKKVIIDMLVQNQVEFLLVLLYVFASAIIDISLLLIKLFQNQYYPKINLILTYQVQETLMRAATKVDYSNFDNSEFYDVMQYALMQTDGLTKSIDSIIAVVSGAIDFLVAIVLCTKYDYVIPILLLSGVAPCCVIKNRLKKYSYDISKEISSMGRKCTGIRHMMISKYYAHLVRSFDLCEFLLSKYKKVTEERIELTVASNKKKNIYSLMASLVNVMTGLFASIRLTWFVTKKFLTLGEYTLLQSYVVKIQTSLNALIESLLKIAEHNLYLENLFSFIDKAEKASSEKGHLELRTGVPHKIEFRHVSFRYSPKDKLILDDVSFIINPGEYVMLMGENGAGKSTLIMLMNGFYDHYTGDIFIDDMNLRSIMPQSVWKNIATMFQPDRLIPLTLRENIRFGQDIADHEYMGYIWFEELVKKYSRGLETILLTYMYPDGITPSGGESQRILLMRTILKKKTGIVVLDEPSSAMDPETEYRIMESMRSIVQGKTGILVSHKLSSAVYADKIIHLRQGRIVESGSHEELMAQDGEYARLFRMQGEKYMKASQ